MKGISRRRGGRHSGATIHSPALKLANAILAFLLVVVVVVPFAIVVNVSLKTNQEYASTGAFAPPQNPFNLANYAAALSYDDGLMLRGFMNSAILIVVSVTLSVVFGTMSAYALERFDFTLRKFMLGLFILSVLIPRETTHVATFSIIKALGLFNTRLAGIVIYSGTDIILITIFLQFINQIPASIDESARIDGASYVTVYLRMIVPLLKPAIVTVIIIKSVWIYNDLFVPLLFMPARRLNTVNLALKAFGEGSGAGRMTEWTLMSAAVVVALLPTLIFYVFFQRSIISGLSQGSTKL
jgi:multiple sugar transport system permease protein